MMYVSGQQGGDYVQFTGRADHRSFVLALSSTHVYTVSGYNVEKCSKKRATSHVNMTT